MRTLEKFAFYGICFWLLTQANGGQVIKQSELDALALTGVRATPDYEYFSLDNPHPRYYLHIYPNNEITFLWEKEMLESASVPLHFLTKIKDEFKFNVRLVNPYSVPSGGTHMFDQCGIQLEYAMKENCNITGRMVLMNEWECTCRDSLPRSLPSGLDTESLKIRHQDKDRFSIEGMETAEYSTVAVMHLEYKYIGGYPKHCSYQIVFNPKYLADNENSEFGDYILLAAKQRIISERNRVAIENIIKKPVTSTPTTVPSTTTTTRITSTPPPPYPGPTPTPPPPPAPNPSTIPDYPQGQPRQSYARLDLCYQQPEFCLYRPDYCSYEPRYCYSYPQYCCYNPPQLCCNNSTQVCCKNPPQPPPPGPTPPPYPGPTPSKDQCMAYKANDATANEHAFKRSNSISRVDERIQFENAKDKKDTPKEMATKAYITYEKFGDTEYEEKQLIEVLKMYKDIAKEFMLEYGPVLEFIWQLAVPNQPGHGTVMEGIKELHKHMDREFRKLEERIDHLETAIKQMLLEITYLTEITKDLDSQWRSYLYMLEAENITAFKSRAKFFVEKCKRSPPDVILDNIILLVVTNCQRPPKKQPNNKTNKLMLRSRQHFKTLKSDQSGLRSRHFKTLKSDQGGLENMCFLSAAYDSNFQKRAPLFQLLEKIRLDLVTLLPIAMTYIKMNEDWKEGSDKNEMLNIVYLKMDKICAYMSRWTVDTLESAWPSVFRKTLELNINNTDGDDYSSSNDKVQANRDSLAKRIKEEIELRGMPGRKYHVHVFSKKPYQVGWGRSNSNRIFTKFFVHDDKAIIYDSGPKNDKMIISIIPLLIAEEGVDHRWANEVKMKINNNTYLKPNNYNNDPSWPWEWIKDYPVHVLNLLTIGSPENICKLNASIRAILVVQEEWACKMGNPLVISPTALPPCYKPQHHSNMCPFGTSRTSGQWPTPKGFTGFLSLKLDWPWPQQFTMKQRRTSLMSLFITNAASFIMIVIGGFSAIPNILVCMPPFSSSSECEQQ